MIKPNVVVFGLILLAGASLTACGRTNGSDAPANDSFASTSTAQEDRFGKGFGKAFRADPNSEPANVVEGDVIPVSDTAEPLPVD